jgi:DNA replication protein DnaD
MHDIIASLILVSEFKKEISKSKKLEKELEASVHLPEISTRLDNCLSKPNNQFKIPIKDLKTVFKIFFTPIELERLHQLSTGPSKTLSASY